MEIKHSVRNRVGLAQGALAAAAWLSKKASQGASGIFTMEDVLE
ncbi:MAG: hypothetical protein LBV52_01935 [Spirochaetaceae bacterium]|nr:hypothetical protein [Spirochaetaceae bacterium]